MKTKILTLSFLLLFYLGNATIINVPGDYTSIQQAINAASVNDTILVDQGSYVENLDISKQLVLASNYIFSNDTSDIEQTIIDGNANGSVIKITNINNVIVRGFTITGGNGTFTDPFGYGEDYLFGGGLFIENANVIEINDNVITNNVLTSEHNSAGGIFINNSDVTINYCNINNNMVNGGSFNGEGAGVFMLNSLAIIYECKIEENVSDVVYGRGGGIYAEDCTLEVIKSHVNNNTSIESGGIYCEDTQLLLNFVEVNNNNAHLTSALYVSNLDTLNCNIYNSTFNNNEVSNSGGTIALRRVYADFQNVVVNDNFGGVNNGGINCTYSEISIKNSELKRNSSDSGIGGDAGAILLYQCDAMLEDVVMDSNFSITPTHFNTGAFTATYCNVVMDTVVITRNIADQGAAINTNSCDIIIKNSLIAQNIALDDGGAIYSYGCDFKIINTTIADNEADVASIFSLYNNFLFLNSILWNEDDVELYYSHSNGGDSHSDFAYTNIRGMDANIVESGNGDVSWMDGNLEVNPLFNDSENLDYTLFPNSPMIDAATNYFEVDGNVVIDYNSDEYYGLKPDMGAFEYDPLTSVKNPEIVENNIKVYPNPFTNYINFELPQNAEFIQMNIYNLNGQLVKTEAFSNTNSNENIDLSNLNSGSYVLQINAENSVSRTMIIKP